MSHFRVVSNGAAEHVSQYDNKGQAEMHYDVAVSNSAMPWDSVRLQMWVEGAGFWHTFKSATPRANADWHSSPLTHSYA